jgi:cbb3-type cytochrome oxidase maturation protein
MDTDNILFWTFLVGLCLALSGCCLFMYLVRDGQYRDPEEAKYRMLEREMEDDKKLDPEVVRV